MSEIAVRMAWSSITVLWHGTQDHNVQGFTSRYRFKPCAGAESTLPPVNQHLPVWVPGETISTLLT